MARTVKGCQIPRPQQGGTEEPESNPSAPQQEEQDAALSEVIADYNQT